ncbi:MAG: peptidoglycan recognition protein family protein [Elusimicrobiales bacterium]|nr:peptidoglycan recognition protein family protein [Elusimicrobiales bacterium]
MLKLLFLFIFMVFSNDPQSYVKFSTDYPLNYSISVDEKTYILYETPISENLSGDFNAIAVQGKVSNVNVSFEIWIPQITEKEGVSYNIIKPSAYKIYKNGRFWVRFDLSTKIEKFKFVVINKGVKDKKFDILVYEVQLTKFDKKKLQILTTDDKSLSLPEVLPFKLIRRAEWEAKKPTGSYTQHTPKKITIHNTAGNYPTSYDDAVIEIQVIQEYHQEGRGWIDIGYHFLVDPIGDIFEGRPILAVGAHVANQNTDNVGISVMGNYHPPVNNEVTESTISSIIKLVKYLKDRYKINKTYFYAHRDLAATDCPGNNVYAKMSYLKTKIFEDKDEDAVSIEVNLGNEELNQRIIEALSNW